MSLNDFNLLADDPHDKELLSNVHPPEWQNPQASGKYNLVVIGAGTAGLVTAAGAAGLGAKVALIEKHLMGGDCLNVGCVPSKALIKNAAAAYSVSEAEKFGIKAQIQEIDFAKSMERLRKLRSEISAHDSAKRFSELGVDVFLGEGKFVENGIVEVSNQRLSYKKAVIATGARALVPKIPGLQEAGYLTNETVFNLNQVPKKLAVIGGGPIGSELAQAFSRLGSEVTIIDKNSRLLSREDEEAAAVLQKQFLAEGIELVFETEVESVAPNKTLLLSNGQKIAADEILVAVGRAPNVNGLNLQSVGIEFNERKGIIVNDYLQTTNPRIYAAGDICLSYKFTHAADAAARIVIQNALFGAISRKAKFSSLVIPYCTYTSPEIAAIGGREGEVYKVELSKLDRAITDGETEGFLKVHAVKEKIVGATIVAKNAGDIISEVSLAMTSGLSLKDIAKTIHPYPTQAEMLKRAADAYGRTRLTPTIAKLFSSYLRLVRKLF